MADLLQHTAKDPIDFYCCNFFPPSSPKQPLLDKYTMHCLNKMQPQGHMKIKIRKGGNTRKLSAVLTDKIMLLETLEKKEIRRFKCQLRLFRC